MELSKADETYRNMVSKIDEAFKKMEVESENMKQTLTLTTSLIGNLMMLFSS